MGISGEIGFTTLGPVGGSHPKAWVIFSQFPRSSVNPTPVNPCFSRDFQIIAGTASQLERWVAMASKGYSGTGKGEVGIQKISYLFTVTYAFYF